MINNNDHMQGDLVTLRPLQEQFFEEYHRMFSPTVRHWLGLPPTSTLQDTVTFLKAALVDPQHLLFFCIFDNPTNKLIGAIVMRSPDHPKGQLGAWVNENFWGGGRYQEALHLALKKYFELTGYDSIFAFVEANNERSLRAHKKMGFEIVEKLPEDAKRLQGKEAHEDPSEKAKAELERKFDIIFLKIVLTRTVFDTVRIGNCKSDVSKNGFA